MKFQVPLPPRELSPNTYKHWRTVSEAKRLYRTSVAFEGVSANVKRLVFETGASKVRLSLTFCIAKGRGLGYQPRDAANALSAFKAGIDGLVDAGMCPDDSAQHLELGAILIDSTRGPYVLVEVEAIE